MTPASSSPRKRSPFPDQQSHQGHPTLLLAILTLCLVGVTFHAWRSGKEKRDVVLLCVFSAPMGAGTAVATIL